MFKITLLFFESNEKGIYTKEEETATDEMWLKMKKERMIHKWLNNLCPHLTISSFCYSLTLINDNNMIYEYELKLIEHLLLPKKKLFKFSHMHYYIHRIIHELFLA